MSDGAIGCNITRTKPERFIGKIVAAVVMGAIGLMIIFFIFSALTLLSLLI